MTKTQKARGFAPRTPLGPEAPDPHLFIASTGTTYAAANKQVLRTCP